MLFFFSNSISSMSRMNIYGHRGVAFFQILVVEMMTNARWGPRVGTSRPFKAHESLLYYIGVFAGEKNPRVTPSSSKISSVFYTRGIPPARNLHFCPGKNNCFLLTPKGFCAHICHLFFVERAECEILFNTEPVDLRLLQIKKRRGNFVRWEEVQ